MSSLIILKLSSLKYFEIMKMVMSCPYNPSRINVASYLGETCEALYAYNKKLENIPLIGDFNVEPHETNIEAFCNRCMLKSLNKELILASKNVDKPSCIDFFLSNCSKCFEYCLALETGMSDFCKLIVTVMKTKHERFPPKIVKYRDYKSFDARAFKKNFNWLSRVLLVLKIWKGS